MLPRGTRVFLTGASGFIGTNLVDLLRELGAEVVNADVHAPVDPGQTDPWHRCDVADREEVARLLAEFDPQMVVHLAARTDTDSTEVSDYAINHVGTANVVSAFGRSPSLSRFVFVSTQFVLGPGVSYDSESQYAPHTAYGQSKAQAEIELRRDPPTVTWTIVRPTNVWGPWHARYAREFWRVLQKGRYVHPSRPDPVRSYGYVGSVCLQIVDVLAADADRVDGRALYVGDEPVRLSQWVDAFSVALRGKRARRVPGPLLGVAARVGDVARGAGLPALITSSRWRSMTEDYPTPMHLTAEALGRLSSVDLADGVAETVSWLRGGRSPDVSAWVERQGSADEGKSHG